MARCTIAALLALGVGFFSTTLAHAAPHEGSARAQCSSALDSLTRDIKAGQRRLYNIAWKMATQKKREAAADQIRQITIHPNRERLAAADRCCLRMSDTHDVPELSDFVCLYKVLH